MPSSASVFCCCRATVSRWPVDRGLGVALALLLAYGARLSKSAGDAALNRLVGLGYAVPGAVIAVGVLIPVTRLDNWLAGQWEQWFGSNPGLLLTGGIAALIYAYLVRFLAVRCIPSNPAWPRSRRAWTMRHAAWAWGRVQRCAGCMCRCCAAAC
jgi:ABC-type spermidine/putrescine transport system permease subunit II